MRSQRSGIRTVRPARTCTAMLAVFLLAAAALAATATPASPATLSFIASTAPSSRSTPAGEPTAYEVRLSGRRVPATFTMAVVGLPSGAAGQFLSTASPLRRILLVRTSTSTPVGSHTFIVEAAAGSVVRRTGATLVVSPGPPPPPPPPTTPPPPPTTPPPTTPPPTTTTTTTAPTTTRAPSELSLRASPLVATVSPGQATAFNIIPDPLGVTVTYLTAGIPAGTRVDLTPNPSFGQMTMTVTTSATTPVGVYTITVTGVTQNQVKSLTVVLDVQVGGLTATPTSQLVVPGGAASYNIAVVPPFIAANPMTFGVSGLPIGATSQFSPTASATGTTLIVSTSASTPPGIYVISVTGIATGASRSTTFQLIVSAPAGTPGFGLAVTPPSASINRGSTVAYNLAVTPQGGFSGPVTIGVTDLPAGASATFVPEASGATLVTGRLIVSTSSSTPAGAHTFRVTAAGSGLTATVTVVLNVT